MYQGYEQLPPLEDDEPRQARQRPVVRAAHPTEDQKLTATLVAGCDGTSLSEWLAPESTFRRGVLSGYFQILVTHLLGHGHVEMIDGARLPLAVAGWLPANAPAAPPDYTQQLARVTGPGAERFRALDEEVVRTRAPGHRRLVFLAVLPTIQSRGLGSALLDHHLRGLGERGICASGNAVGTRNSDFYRRHGFTPHGKPIATAVAADSVLIPMRRSPRPRVGVTAATVPTARSGTRHS